MRPAAGIFTSSVGVGGLSLSQMPYHSKNQQVSSAPSPWRLCSMKSAVLRNPSFGELLEGALLPHPLEVMAVFFLF